MQAGDQVGDVELADDTGTPRRLGALLENGPVVLSLHPVAPSGGCTQEVCHSAALAERTVSASAAWPTSSPRWARNRSGSAATACRCRTRSAPRTRWAVPCRWWLPGGLHMRRRTFVIGPDVNVHADRTLETLEQYRAAA